MPRNSLQPREVYETERDQLKNLLDVVFKDKIFQFSLEGYTLLVSMDDDG
jgi:hypothetical protein